jgi:hypothetical protein
MKPKEILNAVRSLTTGWRSLRPTKSFSGMTLEQYEATVKPSHDARAEIADLESRLQAAAARLDVVDKASLAATRSVVMGIRGDREEGEDGELYAALGYVRKSQRSSGLTRRKQEEAVKEKEAATS